MNIQIEKLKENEYLINFDKLAYLLYRGDLNPPVLYLLKKKDPIVRLRLQDKDLCKISQEKKMWEEPAQIINEETVNIKVSDNQFICIRLYKYQEYYRLVINTSENVKLVGTKIEDAFKIQQLGERIKSLIDKFK